MSREWKPGAVALVTGPARLVDAPGDTAEMVALRNRDCWYVRQGRGWTDREVISVRPLVVIDPENREQVEALAESLRTPIEALLRVSIHDDAQARLADKLVTALRSLIADPKPEEPLGLGAVVEDAEGKRWVAVQALMGGHVWRGGGSMLRPYAKVAAVRVLSEGVTA